MSSPALFSFRLGLPLLLAIGVQGTAWGQQPTDQPEAQPPGRGFRVVWDNRPSFRFGRALRIDLGLRLQLDWQGTTPALDEPVDQFELRRRRIFLRGTFLRHFEYEIERELRADNPWRDVFVDFTYVDDLQIKAGKFKMPFSREQLTGAVNLDFVARSLLAQRLAPARDRGVMAHGRFFQRGLGYELGVFLKDGENALIDEPVFVPSGGELPEGERSLAGRLVVMPLRPLDVGALETLEVGVALTRSTVPEGLNSLHGTTVTGYDFFPRVYVLGQRTRVGAEMLWAPGPFQVAAEYARTIEERDHQGLADADLSDLIGTGWYLSGTWVLTGEPKADGIRPRRPLFQGGLGAVEIGARIEELRFESESEEGPPFRNPRADHVLPNGDRAVTVGINWYLNRYLKIQLNGIHETLEDVERSPVLNRDSYWTGVVRLQIAM
jgi:phosphate-selective porin OprO/OprP